MTTASEAAERLSVALHRALGGEPCKTACTHFLTDRWTLLGIANVCGRVEERETGSADPRGRQFSMDVQMADMEPAGGEPPPPSKPGGEPQVTEDGDG